MSDLRRVLIKGVCVFLGCLLVSGCALGLGKSVHQYALTEDVVKGGKEKPRAIEAEASQNVILGFAFETQFADEAHERLLQQCPRGRVVGISAKHSTDLGFLAYRNKMRLTATCLE